MTTRGPGFLFDSLVATYSLLARAVYTWQRRGVPGAVVRTPVRSGNRELGARNGETCSEAVQAAQQSTIKRPNTRFDICGITRDVLKPKRGVISTWDTAIATNQNANQDELDLWMPDSKSCGVGGKMRQTNARRLRFPNKSASGNHLGPNDSHLPAVDDRSGCSPTSRKVPIRSRSRTSLTMSALSNTF